MLQVDPEIVSGSPYRSGMRQDLSANQRLAAGGADGFGGAGVEPGEPVRLEVVVERPVGCLDHRSTLGDVRTRHGDSRPAFEVVDDAGMEIVVAAVQADNEIRRVEPARMDLVRQRPDLQASKISEGGVLDSRWPIGRIQRHHRGHVPRMRILDFSFPVLSEVFLLAGRQPLPPLRPTRIPALVPEPKRRIPTGGRRVLITPSHTAHDRNLALGFHANGTVDHFLKVMVVEVGDSFPEQLLGPGVVPCTPRDVRHAVAFGHEGWVIRVGAGGGGVRKIHGSSLAEDKAELEDEQNRGTSIHHRQDSFTSRRIGCSRP